MHPWQQSQKPKKGVSHHLHHIFYHIYIQTYIHIYFCICFLLAIAAASCFFSSTLSSSIVEVIKNSRFSLAAAAAAMKDRRGSAGVFPFSIGCMSQSAVDVADPHDKKSTTQNDPSSSASASAAMASAAQSAEEEGGDKAKGAAAVASSGIVATGVQRLIKGIKSLSQIFAMYDDDEEDEEEREMVIGYPTDVQHVGHIGWDGMNKVGGMVNAFSLPSSLSLRQLEMAMEAAHA